MDVRIIKNFAFEVDCCPADRCLLGCVMLLYNALIPPPHAPPPLQLEEAERQRLADIKQAERTKADEEMDVLARASAGSGAPSSVAAASGKTVPPVRAPAKIAVTFSERAFRTPGRESYKAEEDEVGTVRCTGGWVGRRLFPSCSVHRASTVPPRFPPLLFKKQWLAKQAAARKAVNEAKAAKPGDVEHDPLWYRDKGAGRRCQSCESGCLLAQFLIDDPLVSPRQHFLSKRRRGECDQRVYCRM
jgi:hypothetical protein